MLVASFTCSSGSSNAQTPFEELFRLQGTYTRVRLQIPRRSAFARGAEQDSVYIHADTQGQQHLHSLPLSSSRPLVREGRVGSGRLNEEFRID